MPRWPILPTTSTRPALFDLLRRWAWPALLFLTLLAAVWLVALGFVFRGSPGWGYDFEAYLLAAQRLSRGDPLYLSWTLEGTFRPGPYGLYVYAPPLAVAALPLTAVSVPVATAIWFAIRALLLVGGIALMPVRRRIRMLIFVIALASEPVLTDLNLGNVSLILMFLSVVGWRYLDRAPGAIALALAMAVRPTFGLFLVWWALRRRWRPLLWALAVGALLIVVSLPVVGIGAYFDYIRLVGNLSDVTGVANNMDLGATVARLGLGSVPATLALLAGYAVAIVAVIASLRRDREVSFMVTLGATMLLSPLLWGHYLVNALLPAAFLLERGRSWGPRRWGLALGILVLAWAPAPGVPLLALAATLAPFLARARQEPTYAAASRDAPTDTPVDAPPAGDPLALGPAASNRTIAPA